MKTFIFPALVLFLSMALTVPARADRSARDYANELEGHVKKLADDYKDYLQDTRRWKPRGRDAYLFDAIKDLAAAADDLSENLKHGWSRRAVVCYAEVEVRFDTVARYIALAPDRDVQRRFERARDAMIQLSRRGPRRDYRERRDDRRGFRRGNYSGPAFPAPAAPPSGALS